MSGFPPTGFTARTSRLRRATKLSPPLPQPQPHCPRSRSSILPSGAGATLRALAPHLPAESCRQRPRPVGGCRRRVPFPRRSDNYAHRSCARSQSGNRWFPRSGHDFSAARSRVRFLAPTARDRRRGAPASVLWALTYDGRIDSAIIGAVGNHHRRDKGSGPHSARMPQTIATFEALRHFVVKAAADSDEGHTIGTCSRP
jgi:hypothetical protein